jgi:hypothetical protein
MRTIFYLAFCLGWVFLSGTVRATPIQQLTRQEKKTKKIATWIDKIFAKGVKQIQSHQRRMERQRMQPPVYTDLNKRTEETSLPNGRCRVRIIFTGQKNGQGNHSDRLYKEALFGPRGGLQSLSGFYNL